MKLFYLLFLLTSITAAQINIYLPNGKIKNFPPKTTLGQIQKTFEPDQLISDFDYRCNDKNVQVYYKFFTREPLFILAEDSACIGPALENYNFTKYMRSLIAEVDIERYMKKGKLTDLYVLNTLGHPDNIKKDVTGKTELKLYFYYDYNLVLKFKNGYVVGYMR